MNNEQKEKNEIIVTLVKSALANGMNAKHIKEYTEYLKKKTLQQLINILAINCL